MITTSMPLIRLDYNDDGSAEVYAECPGDAPCPDSDHARDSTPHDLFIGHLSEKKVRVFRKRCAADRVAEF